MFQEKWKNKTNKQKTDKQSCSPPLKKLNITYEKSYVKVEDSQCDKNDTMHQNIINYVFTNHDK